MNPDIFWGIVRTNIFNGRISTVAFNTVNHIVDTYYAHYMPTADPEHLAYILATAGFVATLLAKATTTDSKLSEK